MIRICIIPHSLGFSGAPIAAYSLARALVELGFEVSVVGAANEGLVPYFRSLNVKIIDRIGLDFDLYIPVTLLRLDVARELKRRGKKVFVWLHESPEYQAFSTHPAFDPKNWLLDYYDLVVCVSHAQKKAFATEYPGARYLVMEYCSPVDLFEEEQVHVPLTNFVHYPGGIETRKGQEDFLRALRQLGHLDCDIVFVGAEREALATLSTGHPHRSKMHATGTISPSRSMAISRQSKGLISFSRAEVKPFTVVEALSFGKPCLLVDTPAFRNFENFQGVHFLSQNAASSLEEFLWSAASEVVDSYRVRCIFSLESFKTRVEMLMGVYQMFTR